MKRKISMFLAVMLLAFSFAFSFGCKKEVDANVNLVLQIEFSDTQNSFSQKDSDLLKQAFNGETNSLDNFIYLNSNGNYTVKSNLLGTVKIDKPIDYFMPKYRYNFELGEYEEVNALGYDSRLYDDEGNVSTTGKQSAERFYREQELLYQATLKAEELTKSLDRVPEFENLTLVPSKLGRYVYSGDIFHPHQATHYTGDASSISSAYHTEGVTGSIKPSYINKTEVDSYVIIPFAYISDGQNTTITTLCHEYMHVLGVPDLYTYDGNKKPVGEFDVMGGETTLAPTQSLAYVKYKMDWLKEGEDILPIATSGEYNLTAMEDEGGVKAYKITLGSYYENGDVFYLEYRKLANAVDNSSAGVIIYRVNEENGYISSSGEKANVWRGNAYGDFEVLLFRNPLDVLYGKHPTICQVEGYTTYGNPNGYVNVITNSDGTNSNILVEYLGENPDGTAKIRVEIPKESISIPNDKIGLSEERGSRHSIYFDRADGGKVYVYYSSKQVKNPTPEKLLKGKKGELITTNTAFLKTKLPKAGGIEKYIYVFYEEGNGYSAISEYKISGIKEVKIGKVLILAFGIGILLPSTLLAIVNKIPTKTKEKEKTPTKKKE